MPGLAKGWLRGTAANWANPPPSDLAPARQVTFPVTYVVGCLANRANQGVVWGAGGGGALRDSVEHHHPVIGHGWPW